MNKQDLRDMYASDSVLMDSFHIRSGAGLDACTEDTWDIIKDCDKHLHDWGYFAIDRTDIVPKLCGFFIKRAYRNDEYKQLFYESLCLAMPNTFLSTLHNKNTRGIKFLLKFGKIVSVNDKHTFFVFKKGR